MTKRELIEPNKGEHSDTKAPKGQGDRGDR